MKRLFIILAACISTPIQGAAMELTSTAFKHNGTIPYVFKLYALKEPLVLKPGADAKSLAAAMSSKILVETKLIGLYAAGR